MKRGMHYLIAVMAILLLGAFMFVWPDFYPFDGGADNTVDSYYYVITGGVFPTGNIPNGDNASGGTFRYLLDEPLWGGYPLNVWNKDDWFPENAGMALTLKLGDTHVYDNNGLEDGSGAYFYVSGEIPANSPGLYRGYSMPNNWDWIYATYFKLNSTTTFDTIIGYFDGNGVSDGPFDPNGANIDYRFNFWSAFQDNPGSNPNSWMPAVASFTGDVFTTDGTKGVFSVSYTGIDRIFPEGDPYYGWRDPIWRVVFRLSQPVTIPSGVYFFSNQAVIVTPLSLDIKPGSDTNGITLRSKGLVPVAVLGTDEFLAEDVDPDTVLFAGAQPVRWTWDDVNDDDYTDLLLHFRTQDLLLTSNSTSATLTGFTFSSGPVKGVDSVKIVPKGK